MQKTLRLRGHPATEPTPTRTEFTRDHHGTGDPTST